MDLFNFLQKIIIIYTLLSILYNAYKQRKKVVQGAKVTVQAMQMAVTHVVLILSTLFSLIGSVILKIDKPLTPYKPSMNLTYTLGIETIYAGCILMAGSFLLLGFHLQLIPTADAYGGGSFFLGIGLFFRYIIRNK